jgi:hypothetical protein
MADLIFPQLSSGAVAQYPIRKTNKIRTIKNILADGSMIVLQDPGAGQLVWSLSYVALQPTDMTALRAHFVACGGPLRHFTFLDPTDNLLTNSAYLTQSPWVIKPEVTIEPNMPDPFGGIGAFYVTNGGSAPQTIIQTLTSAPVNFQYCFSVYAASPSGGTCSLIRSSAAAQQTTVCPVGPLWSRILSSGVLDDTGIGLSVTISLAAGQSLSLFGPQLEPQFAPSRFRPTYSNGGVYTTASSGGVYTTAHWAAGELIFTADAPNLFSTSFSIETSVWT